MLKIVTVPDPVLSAPTKAVTIIDEKIKELVGDMEKTLGAQKDPMGVGLAANQVGFPLSLFVIKKSPKSDTEVFINPKIIKIIQSSSKQVKTSSTNSTNSTKKKRKPIKLEGCLSIPRIWGPVKRANKILLEYQDLAPGMRKKWFQGFEATIIQHEIDHLDGVVFTQRCLEQKRQLFKEAKGELKPIEV